jgi:hypothetical protein
MPQAPRAYDLATGALLVEALLLALTRSVEARPTRDLADEALAK